MRKLNKSIWPVQTIVIDYEGKIEQWCKDILGRRFRDWYSYDSDNGRVYAFRDEETLLVFKLRWMTKKV